MSFFQSDSKTDLNLRCNYCIKFQHKTFLVDWRLCIASYCPIISTEYPSTTRGTPVDNSLTVNIDFCGYLRLLRIRFVWNIFVQYATENLSGPQLLLVPQASVYIQPTADAGANDKQKPAVPGGVITETNADVCWYKNQDCRRGLGGGRGPFWLHEETLPFQWFYSIANLHSI
jgi:hypothetical protein